MYSSCMALFHIASQSTLMLCMQPVQCKYEQLKVVTASCHLQNFLNFYIPFTYGDGIAILRGHASHK